MRDSERRGQNTYRLVLEDDRKGVGRTIEFEATGADSALVTAQRLCAGRTAELFESGRSLGHVRNDANWGFWELTPPTPRPALKLVAEEKEEEITSLAKSA